MIKNITITMIALVLMILPMTVKAEELNYIYDNGKVFTYEGSIKDINIIMSALEDNLGKELYFKSSIDERNLSRELFLNMSQKLAKYKYSISLFDIKDDLFMIRCASKEQVEADKDLDKKINKIYKELKINDKTDIEKITKIHDYIVTNYKYDFINYSISESLESKLLKCDGYAALFQLLAEKAGIKSIVVTGYDEKRDILHTFNLVKINKKWYHVDCTYDATQYKKGKNYHTFLLIKKLSDYELGIKYQDLKLATKSYKLSI
jgi:hypothetical protein